MKAAALLCAIFCLSIPGLHAEAAHVLSVKSFSFLYPSSFSLKIPFNGSVALNHPLPSEEGEYWLSLDDLTTDDDFEKIEVLVDGNQSILGARAKFKGTAEEWEGDRGYAARKRVLTVFLGGDGPDFTKSLPAAYDGTGFGGMIYTFDCYGHVSWRKYQGAEVMKESSYIRKFEDHIRNCEECKDLSAQPEVVLTRPEAPAKDKR